MGAKKILFIDDEIDLLEIVEYFLDKRGIHADYESNPEKALERIMNDQYSHIFCDVRMPKLTGIDLLEAIKKNNVPVEHFAFITAYKSLSKKEAMELGANNILYKPYSPQDLLDYIRKLNISAPSL